MGALFGEGLHPNADHITELRRPGAGIRTRQARPPAGSAASSVVRDGEPEFARRLAVAYREHNAEVGRALERHHRPRESARDIRTRVAVELFAEEYGRPPADDRELSGFIARNTRARTTAVAGYDLTFTPVKSVSALWAIAPLDGGRADRGRPRRGGRRRAGVAAKTKPRSPAPAPTGSPRSTPTADRRGVHPPRLPRRRPRPAHPRRDLQQGATSTPTACAAGWPWTVNRCTGSPSPPRSCTTPAWKPT